MPPCTTQSKINSRRAFTLVELLVVVAIIAVVGAGLTVYYGREVVDDSKDRLTLHEMQEIKRAFLRFHNDNYFRLQREFADHNGEDLPSGFTLARPIEDNELNFYGRMDFFEKYGLWFLLQQKIFDDEVSTRLDDSGEYRLFPEFESYDVESGEDWNGPYVDAPSRLKWTKDEIDFPQISDKFGDAYRILYFEHSRDFADLEEPIYRRLFLISQGGLELTDEDLLDLTGNQRGGSDDEESNPLDLDTGALKNLSRPFIIELLNLDQIRE